MAWCEFDHFDDYSAGHVEKYRPPSKGGNTSAIHAHRIEIEGEGYYFMARGSRQWVYKGGRGRFAWYTKDNRCIILRGTLQIWDKDSNPVTRGDHRAKRKQRTAETRMPVSRREMRD